MDRFSCSIGVRERRNRRLMMGSNRYGWIKIQVDASLDP